MRTKTASRPPTNAARRGGLQATRAAVQPMTQRAIASSPKAAHPLVTITLGRK